MDNFYTPDISELHVGFEIYLMNSENAQWGRYTIRATDSPSEFEGQSIRVKHLDQDAFINSGFVVERNELNFTLYTKFVVYRGDKQKCEICYVASTHWAVIEVGKKTVFAGKIKNINEFQRLQKQLNIK